MSAFFFFFFFFNDTATTEIYTLSLHDALPISCALPIWPDTGHGSSRRCGRPSRGGRSSGRDRKSTRLNSSHSQISYAVFCLKKKKTKSHPHRSEWCQSRSNPIYVPSMQPYCAH